MLSFSWYHAMDISYPCHGCILSMADRSFIISFNSRNYKAVGGKLQNSGQLQNKSANGAMLAINRVIQKNLRNVI